MTEAQKHPLTVEVADGKLVISIGVETLAFATWHADDVFERGDRIADVDAFGRDVARQLRQEEDDGTTPVHRLLDQAVRDGLENGDMIDSVRLAAEDEPSDTSRALHVIEPSILEAEPRG